MVKSTMKKPPIAAIPAKKKQPYHPANHNTSIQKFFSPATAKNSSRTTTGHAELPPNQKTTTTQRVEIATIIDTPMAELEATAPNTAPDTYIHQLSINPEESTPDLAPATSDEVQELLEATAAAEAALKK
jgi:hypothetical protein